MHAHRSIPTEIVDHRRLLTDVWPLDGLVSHRRTVPMREDRAPSSQRKRDRRWNAPASNKTADLRRREQVQPGTQPPATKDDIAEVRAELAALRQATKAEIAAVRADMEAFRLSTKAELESIRRTAKADLDRSTAETKAQFLKWMLAAFGVQITVFIVATVALAHLTH
jgi:uncharacterized membrane protein YqiK